MSRYPFDGTWRSALIVVAAVSLIFSATAIGDESKAPETVFAQTTTAEMQAFDEAQAAIEAGAGAPHVVPFLEVPAQDVGGGAAVPGAPEAAAPELEVEPPGPLAPPLIASFAGTADNNTTIPPDTMGAAGSGNHVVVLLNSGFAVYNKLGALIFPQISLQSFWSALGTGIGDPARRVYDPKVIFDQYSNSWIATADGNPNNADGSGNSWVLVAISHTSDPLGVWNLYGIRADVGVHANDWADYPGFGVDPNNVIITNNMFTQVAPPNNPAFVHADVWVIEKAKMIAGLGPLVQGVDYALFHAPQSGTPGLNGATFQPCHTFGQLPGPNVINYIIDSGWTSGGGANTHLRIHAITGVGAGAVLNGLGGLVWYQINNYNFAYNDAPQPGGCVPIRTNDQRLLNAVLRNNRIYTTHTVGNGAGKTEVAWYELNPANAGPLLGGLPVQQGRVSHNTLYYYFPSIAVNKDGCIALGFSGSDAGTYASGFYTLRQPGDPLGTMQPVSLLKAGEDMYFKNFSNTQNRWGDFSATVIDPADDTTFWTVQEYARPSVPPGSCADDTGRWGTWVGSFACSQNTVACCFTDGSCADLTASACQLAGGTSQGAGTSCATHGGQCQLGEACCLDTGGCVNADPIVCAQQLGGTPQGPGTNCATTTCQQFFPKFRQPPEGDRENIISNIAFSGGLPTTPNRVVADDFRSDGRPIVRVRWWGSYIDPAYRPVEFGGEGGFRQIDGWLISFHEPLQADPAAPAAPPLGLYFAPHDKVRITRDPNVAACDGHEVFDYVVDLRDCCLLHAMPDSRSNVVPAQEGVFKEQYCFDYDLDIQAVIGETWVPSAAAGCQGQPTNHFTDHDVWGWHATFIEAGLRAALESFVTMSPPNWLYGPWRNVLPICSPPPVNMSFILYTDDPNEPEPCPDEACCLPDNTCQNMPAENCVELGGIPQGFGTTCETITCGEPCPDRYVVEFSLDIGSDAELSDPKMEGNEVFDPGDVYIAGGPYRKRPRDGFKDDECMFFGPGDPNSMDPFPDPQKPGSEAPVGKGCAPGCYAEYFDLDGHDQIDLDVRQYVPLDSPLEIPIPRFPSRCVHPPDFLVISFDDDLAPGWAAVGPPLMVPIDSPSPAGLLYGTTANRDELIGLTLAAAPGPPFPGLGAFVPWATETAVHPNLWPNPVSDRQDDDVDSLDIMPPMECNPDGEPNQHSCCPILLFSPDHEGVFFDPVTGTILDPGDIYQVNTTFACGPPFKVIDEEIHLGLRRDTDVDAFELTWLPAPDGFPPGRFLAIIFSVDEDDPETPNADESGGLDPTMLYFSYMTGFSRELVPKGTLEDDVDAIAIWCRRLEPPKPPTFIVGRHLFYNDSYYDGNNAGINAGPNGGTNHDHDDDAIDPTKSPLLPGDGVAQIPNWTGFTKGITGLMFDVVNPTAAPTPADFAFLNIGKNGLAAVPVAPDSFLVRPGAGVGGSDRVVVTFSGLVNTWLEVAIGPGFGLPSPDVSYWGNAAGDGQSPGSPTLILVDGADIVGARDNPHTILTRAPVEDEYDYNKDSLVDGTDIVYARDHPMNILTAVSRITR